MEEAGVRDWKARLIGFGSDGAAVNLGSKSGVAARLKQEVEHLVSIHCTAHRLELGVVGAVKEHPKMANLQEELVHLYDQYHFSPKAIWELHEIAEALEEKVLRLTTLRGARWLPYIYRAIKVLNKPLFNHYLLMSHVAFGIYLAVQLTNEYEHL